jgi:hypothetical protein
MNFHNQEKFYWKVDNHPNYKCLSAIGCRATSGWVLKEGTCNINGWSFDRYDCNGKDFPVCEYTL